MREVVTFWTHVDKAGRIFEWVSQGACDEQGRYNGQCLHFILEKLGGWVVPSLTWSKERGLGGGGMC